MDRIILIVLAVGVWGLLGTMWLKPSNVDAHDDGHAHYGIHSEEGHSHDGHTHLSHELFGVAAKGHSHTCDVIGGYAECY